MSLKCLYILIQHKAIKKLKEDILQYCQQHKVVDFYTEELESVDELAQDDSRDHGLFVETVKQMEEEGLLYMTARATHSARYKVCSSGDKILTTPIYTTAYPTSQLHSP